MKDKIVTLVLILVALGVCFLIAVLFAMAVNKYFDKPAATAGIQTNSPPTTQQIVWMTNYSLVFSKDGKEIIYKPETEVGFGNDGAVFVRIKKH